MLNLNNSQNQSINTSSFRRNFDNYIHANPNPIIVDVDDRMKYVQDHPNLDKNKIYYKYETLKLGLNESIVFEETKE